MTQRPPTSPKKPVTGWQRTLVIGIDKLIYRFSRHWLATFTLILALYVGLPILAPVLMAAGVEGPAHTIYRVYRPMCHQMASRSFFLFGEQVAYPRPLAGTELAPLDAYLSDIPPDAYLPGASVTFADYSGNPSDLSTFLEPARQFIGTEQMGYKMALCERDIAIYGFVLLAGLAYGLLRRRRQVRALPLWGFVLIGLVPVGLDGFSQLLAYLFAAPGGATGALADVFGFLQQLFPLRESTPFLRTLTGALFGGSLVWLTYPQIEGGMRSTAQQLEEKLGRIGELPGQKG
jgi:uncharacterized membrane protein